MQKHLEAVLTDTGLSAEQVKALVDLPEDAADFKTDDFVKGVHTVVETKVKNDPEFYKGLNKENMPKEFLKVIESEQYGRAANIVRTNILKATGLSEKDFEALGEEGKKIDVFTPAFVKKVTEGKITDKELQAKLIEANQKIETLESGLPDIEKKYQGEYEGKIADYQFTTGVLTTLASVPGLKAPAKYLLTDIAAQLKGKYGFAIVNGEVELRQKDHPDLKVLNKAGTEALTLKAAVETILTADALVDKKATTTTTTTTKLNVDGDEGKGLKIGKHVASKMDKRLEEDKKLAGQA